MRTGLLVGMVFAFVAAATLCTPGAEAKGRFLNAYPSEATWGETVYVDGFNFPREGVHIFTRFASTRAALESVPLGDPLMEARVLENGTFLEQFTVHDLPGQEGTVAPPGWLEIVARLDERAPEGPMELSALVVVTAKGQRPAGSAFIEGQVSKLPGMSTDKLYVAWAPASDPASYQFRFVGDSGRVRESYRTGYLDDGEWLVGPVDIGNNTAAIGFSLESITAIPGELDHEVTWRFRRVTIRNAMPVGGIDFVMADKALAESRPLAEALPAAGAGSPTSDSPSWLWLAGSLLVIGPLALFLGRMRR